MTFLSFSISLGFYYIYNLLNNCLISINLKREEKELLADKETKIKELTPEAVVLLKKILNAKNMNKDYVFEFDFDSDLLEYFECIYNLDSESPYPKGSYELYESGIIVRASKRDESLLKINDSWYPFLKDLYKNPIINHD